MIRQCSGRTGIGHLLFDRTGRWGMESEMDDCGVLGGEPEFMERFAAKSGGWAELRRKADILWQLEVDEPMYEARFID